MSNWVPLQQADKQTAAKVIKSSETKWSFQCFPVPNSSVYHYTTPLATTLSNINCMFSIDIVHWSLLYYVEECCEKKIERASLLPAFRFSIFLQVSPMFIIKNLFKCLMYYLVLLTVKGFSRDWQRYSKNLSVASCSVFTTIQSFQSKSLRYWLTHL